jgi:hypothetical protein
MKASLLTSIVLLPLAALGCGTSPPPPPQAVASPTAPPAAPVADKADQKPAPRPAKRERPPAERAKVAQLFQVPQVTRANAGNYSDARQDSGGTPLIRLLGFSQMDGQLRALVQIKGETLPVEQGDIVDGVEIVAVDAEGVSFQYGAQRWTSKLFEKLESRPVVVARAPSQSSPAVSDTPSASPPVEVTSPTLPMVEPSPSPSN